MSDTRRGFLAKTGFASLSALVPWRASAEPEECSDHECHGCDDLRAGHTFLYWANDQLASLRDSDVLYREWPKRFIGVRSGGWHGWDYEGFEFKGRYVVYHLRDVHAAIDWVRG